MQRLDWFLVSWLVFNIMLFSLVLGVFSNVQYDESTPVVKTQQKDSMWLKQGYDKRVQSTIPAYSLYMGHLDNYKLVVR